MNSIASAPHGLQSGRKGQEDRLGPLKSFIRVQLARRRAHTREGSTAQNADPRRNDDDQRSPRRQRSERAGAARARNALTDAPQAAQFKWQASNKWLRGTHSRSEITGYFGLGEQHSHRSSWSFDADHPEVFASEDNGPTPVEYDARELTEHLAANLRAAA
jgi:hypothetical protein